MPTAAPWMSISPAAPTAAPRWRGHRSSSDFLATAAKLEWPGVRFEAPPAEAVRTMLPPAETRGDVLPLPRRPRMRSARWAMAAAVLVAVGLPAWLIGRAASEYADARAVVQQGEDRINAAQNETRQIAEARQRLPERFAARIEEVRNAEREKELKLAVRGPANLQAGAATEFQLQACNLNDQPIAVDVDAFVSFGPGKTDRHIPAIPVEEAGCRKAGAYRLILPPDLPVGPGDTPKLCVHAKRETGPHTEVSETLSLVRPVYVTHLTTDKPMYQPGQTVYFRSLTLDRSTLRPPAEPFQLLFKISNTEVKDQVIAQGSTALVAETGHGPVMGPDGTPMRSVGAGAMLLSATAPGGEYVLSVEDAAGRFPRQERRFIVNRYQKHYLNKELDFSRKSYGPGDEVQALCKVKNVNGPVRNAQAAATVLIDGKTYGVDGRESSQPIQFRTDDEGTVTVRFTLPASIDKGQATLAVVFNDGTNVETLARTIPLVLKKLQVEFFPEGGDLVAGLPNRVYFQVRTPLGKPADLRGRLLRDGKPLDVTLETLTDAREPGVNQGMGRFEFTPQPGGVYAVQVESPAGVTDRFTLPTVKADGVVLSVPDGVLAAGKPIHVQVRWTKPRALMVGAYCRGRLLDSALLARGQTEAVLTPASGDGGVCRITVFEVPPANANVRILTPVAERLIYRQPTEQLRIALRHGSAVLRPRSDGPDDRRGGR